MSFGIFQVKLVIVFTLDLMVGILLLVLVILIY